MLHDALAPGTVIAGKYMIERTLGRGGMGAVYVASHTHTGKRLALKCLLPELVLHADLVGRFLREAQVMGRLQHRHVVDVFDVGRDGDVLYIVMELLDGKPLAELLHDTSLTLEEALLILLRAMEGVAAAHDQGVIHRDLKPDNIFVCIGASGRLDDPRVLDFGISKLEGADEQITRSGVAMGTPYYMSIEQLNGQRDLDQRVDVYALGVILYEALSGEPPYVADSMSALAIRVLTTEASHLGELRPDLPPGLADVVMKAIAKSRDDRHRSVRQLIEALRPYLPRSAGLALPEGQGRPLRTPGGGRAPRPSVSQLNEVLARRPAQSRPGPTTEGDRASKLAGSGAKRIVVSLAIIAFAGAAALVIKRASSEQTAAHESGDDSASRSAGDMHAGESPLGDRALPPEPAPSESMAVGPELPAAADAGSASPTREIAAKAAGALPLGKAPPPQRAKRAPGGSLTKPPEAKTPASRSPAPAESPTPQPAAGTRKSAQGRAGQLGSDEF